jgi:hypothetical protein
MLSLPTSDLPVLRPVRFAIETKEFGRRQKTDHRQWPMAAL